MEHGVKRSELDKLEDRAYNQLKEGIYRTKFASGVFKCPFCVEKKSQEHMYDDILQHACMRGNGSKTSSLKQQAQHMALSSYLRKYCSPKAPSKRPNEVSSHGETRPRKMHTGQDEKCETRPRKMHTGQDEKCETRPRKMHIEQDEKFETRPRKMHTGQDEKFETRPRIMRTGQDEKCETHPRKMHTGQDEKCETRPRKMHIGQDEKCETRPRKMHTGQDEKFETCPRKMHTGQDEKCETRPRKMHTGQDEKCETRPRKMHTGQDEKCETRPRKMQRHPGEQGSREKQDTGKKFVFPWKGIIINVPVELKDGKYFGEGGNRLKENLIGQGFMPLKVTPIWTYSGYTGCSVVDFGSDWPGFSNAMMFEKAFEVERRGRSDWYKTRSHGDKLFGWVASKEDFDLHDPLGRHLQKFDLKSIDDIESEEERKTRSLVSQLHSTIEAKDLQYKVMESKLQAASISMNLVIEESDAMIEAHNEEMSAMCEIQHNDTKRMLADHRRTLKRLEEQKRWLDLCERNLEKREARNENEQRELSRKQRQNELAYQEQKEADMRKLELAEEHKREKEALHIRINNLRKEIDHKQAIELKIEHLKGALQVLKHVEHEDMEAKNKMEAIAEELKEREEELEEQEDFKQALIIKEKKSKEELQEARKELINNLESYSSKGRISLKIVGTLDAKPFEVGAMARYSDGDMASVKAAEMWSLWESYLRDTNWHPFKLVSNEGITKEVINEEDERLKGLRTEVGEGAYEAVVTALIELNEYNPGDRTPVPELWNINEGRRAEVSEAAEHLVNIWKNQKRK